jgi:hypothetical protein
MKRLLIVLFGVLVFQGSVWALTSADDLCQQDGDNGKATVLSPADTQELDKSSPLLLQWQDKAQWLQSKVTIKLHSRTGKKERVVKTWPSQTNTGSALITREDLRKVQINRNASKQDIRYFFRLTNHRKTERFIESGCFTFTKNLKRQRSRQNLKEEVAALESSLTLALATIEGLTDRLQALEGRVGTTGGVRIEGVTNQLISAGATAQHETTEQVISTVDSTPSISYSEHLSRYHRNNSTASSGGASGSTELEQLRRGVIMLTDALQADLNRHSTKGNHTSRFQREFQNQTWREHKHNVQVMKYRLHVPLSGDRTPQLLNNFVYVQTGNVKHSYECTGREFQSYRAPMAQVNHPMGGKRGHTVLCRSEQELFNEQGGSDACWNLCGRGGFTGPNFADRPGEPLIRPGEYHNNWISWRQCLERAPECEGHHTINIRPHQN